jgi:hypothetical protein
VRVKSYKEAVRLANSAGLDAAKRRMGKAGRKVMSASDYDHAAGVTTRVLTDLGFDVMGWMAMAGVPRNEPAPPLPAAKKRGSRAKKPEQLSFAFA